MPSNPAEPEKYSLDEMLERLQGKQSPAEPESGGELVTRADGTQAIKVRRRKRRSVQPHKEEAKRTLRLRAIQISSLAVFIILLGLSFGALFVYSNSTPFRNKLIAKLSEATGAKTTLQQMRVTPAATRAVLADFQWPAGSTIKRLSITDVNAQTLIGGTVGSSWSANEISASRGSVEFGDAEPGQPTRFFPKPTGGSPVHFNRLAVNKLNLLVGSSTDPVIRLNETEATFYPGASGSKSSVRLYRGQSQIRDWPSFRLDRGLFESANGSDIEIVTLRLLHELDNTGSIELSGNLKPGSIASGQRLGVKMSSFNLNGIAGPSLGHLIAGRIDSAGSPESDVLEFSKTGGSMSVNFTSSPNTLPKANNFPFLTKLSKITENPWFIDTTFRDVFTGTLHRDREKISMTGLNLLSRTHLWITGDLSIAPNDVLTGNLKVGLPEAVVNSSQNKGLASAFSESRDGFRWISLKISGTGSRPIDDFDEVTAGAAAAGGSEGQDMFDRLTTPKGE